MKTKGPIFKLSLTSKAKNILFQLKHTYSNIIIAMGKRRYDNCMNVVPSARESFLLTVPLDNKYSYIL